MINPSEKLFNVNLYFNIVKDYMIMISLAKRSCKSWAKKKFNVFQFYDPIKRQNRSKLAQLEVYLTPTCFLMQCYYLHSDRLSSSNPTTPVVDTISWMKNGGELYLNGFDLGRRKVHERIIVILADQPSSKWPFFLPS